jgi:hypothetical protein
MTTSTETKARPPPRSWHRIGAESATRLRRTKRLLRAAPSTVAAAPNHRRRRSCAVEQLARGAYDRGSEPLADVAGEAFDLVPAHAARSG